MYDNDKGKINGLWNIGHWPTYILRGQSLCHTDPLSQVQLFSIDMKQIHWTIKYRSLTYIYMMRSIFLSHWPIIPIMMFIHQIILTILSKITRPWNVGHIDLYLYLFWSQSFGHTVSLSENMTFIHQIVYHRDIRQNQWIMNHRSQWHTFIVLGF